MSKTPKNRQSTPNHGRAPTMEDVAGRAGVSRALVSLVMRNSPKVSSRSRLAVEAAAAELGYRPNLMARHLASHRTNTIGLVLNDLHNPFFAEVADGVHREASTAGYRVVIATGFGAIDGEKDATDTFLDYRVDALLMAGPRLSDEELNALGQLTKLAIIGRTIASDDIDSVNNDELVGAKLAIDHLVGLGHQDIAHIDGGLGAGAPSRRRGYIAAMSAHGLSSRIRIIEGDFTERAGVAGVDRLLTQDVPLSAIFAANDVIAAGVLHRLDALGIDVPSEVSLVGYDNTALAALGHINLSTVNQPRELMGQLGVRLLVDRLESDTGAGTHQVLAPTFVSRSTSGPATA